MKSIRAKSKSLNKPISSDNKLAKLVEKRHIQAHLALTELRLRTGSKKVATRSSRVRALDILHNYWQKGVFPTNTYLTSERTPVFIDEYGVYCAVGHLMAQTGYSNLAEQINTADRFVQVEQLNNPEVELWLQKVGISKNEAALIQPGYGGFIIEGVSYSLQDRILGVASLLACFAILTIVVIALRLLGNKTLPKQRKRNHFLKIVFASVVIIMGIVLYLPNPKQAVEILTSRATSKEMITCEGWNTPKDERPSVCNEFEQNGSVPGWRKVPCESICIL